MTIRYAVSASPEFWTELGGLDSHQLTDFKRSSPHLIIDVWAGDRFERVQTPKGTIADNYRFTIYATTPGGHRFAVASYPTRDAANAGAEQHRATHLWDKTEILSCAPRTAVRNTEETRQ